MSKKTCANAKASHPLLSLEILLISSYLILRPSFLSVQQSTDELNLSHCVNLIHSHYRPRPLSKFPVEAFIFSSFRHKIIISGCAWASESPDTSALQICPLFKLVRLLSPSDLPKPSCRYDRVPDSMSLDQLGRAASPNPNRQEYVLQ